MAHRRKRKDRESAERARAEAQRRQRQRTVWAGLGALIAVVIVVAAVLLVPAATTPVQEGADVGPKPGQVAPDFSLVDVNGNSFDLGTQRGNVVLLDFMGSRCASCILEMPHLVATHQQFQGRNFAMISIDVGGGLGTEDPNVARNFLATHGGTWPIALDNQGLGVTYEVRGLSTLVVIDATGIVQLYHGAGILTSDDLIPVVEGLL